LELAQLTADQLAGGYRSAYHGAGIEFDEVREYVPGDDPRAVDWNVTARVGKPFIKKYVDERERCVFVLFDCSARMRAGLGDWSLADAMVRLCGIWAHATERYDDPIGWIAFDEEVRRVVPPRKGAAHSSALIGEAQRTCAGPLLDWSRKHAEQQSAANLEMALQRALGVLKRRCTLVVISDFAAEPPIEMLGRARRKHDVLLLPLRAAEWQRKLDVEVEGCAYGAAHFSKPGAGSKLLDEWCARRQQGFDRAQCDTVWIDVPWQADIQALARPLQEHFRRRARSRRRR